MNIQEIIINLKVIESLEVNQKLITKETILNIEPLSIIPEFARRWLRQDSREESIKKITSVVDKAIVIIEKQQGIKKLERESLLETRRYIENNDNNTKNNKNNKNNKNLIQSVYYDCDEIINSDDSLDTVSIENSDCSIDILYYLYKSKKGLHNLKKTYYSSVKTGAEIDFIIDKIQAIYDKYNK